MAKVKLDYMSLSMRAEGSDDMVRELSGRFLDMADKYAAPGFYFPALPPSVFEDGCRDPEELNTGDMKPLTTPKEVAPGADWDVVAIYDDAGIPSIMHRFRRMSNKELFGGSDKPHPAFIIGGEVYDEIYISVYPNVMINGKPYSLPFQKPAGNITLDDFSKACFSKGEGWHPMTAAEWGFLANLSLKLGTLPHGNTDYGAWHGDHKEHGQKAPNSNRTLTGTGPETWTHDHTKTGVHDLCGNIWEVLAGLRIKNGVLMVAANNDAALPETDLTQCGDDWKLLTDDKGAPVYVSASGSEIVFNLLFVFVIHPGGVWGWAALCGATRLECPRWNHASTPAAMLAKSSCWTLGTISGALCLWLSSSRAITNAAASRSLLIKSQR